MSARAALLGLALAAAAAAPARAQLALAQANNCRGCHQVERKVVGPPYRDVAARYAGQAGAATRLAAKIRSGGAGAWGPVPMPANPQVSEADAARLARWVLTLAPAPAPAGDATIVPSSERARGR